ncbi:Leucine-rich repeat,Leucine-rich repeat domain, L domain-like,Leucine-rich repeat, typical subtype,Leucine [Cinara cedri]|uniref:Leucine-rich repeat,Leucine-rich repeat domain, L domain-like,Leucine-rich repeat, typical subtype,Leucine n=1 Tax=Cinara cedri TaxID=506608 RepID=A0A5E4N5P6_9HEMI|nr:Leucine-rich repeat,Leucine-rich repeat domain, L domain-like,Leucine-rich repeat, typical subtype,Leucine [Cinara cedri]
MATRSISVIVLATLLACVCNVNAILSEQFDCPDDCDCHLFRINWVTDCSESNFTSMPYEGLDPNVYVLNMNGNLLKDIEPFPSEIKLRTLQLSENILTKIKKSTFAGLHYLLDIDLSNNLINYVDPEAFVDSAGLITLELQGNPLEQVDGPFLYSKSLLYLYLADNHLSKLSPQFFANISGLDKLDLSGNPLHIIEPGIFDPLTSLKHLILNNCNLTHISSVAFSSLGHLTILELAGNSLKSHIDWILILGNLGRLEHLELRQSGVSNLPENVFFNNTWLRSLVLAENELSDLDVATTLGHNLVHLDFLDLSYCHLKGPLSEDAFANATKLRTLILSGNHLSANDLAVALSPLLKLVKLSLRDCGLTRLPANTFHKFTSLQELDISRNPLNNAFTALLSPLESLEHLDMGYSNLQRISRTTFFKMSALKTLILSGNKLKSLESGLFQNLTRLEVLELNNCGLSRLNDTVFYDNFTYPDLEELRLSGNPLQVPEQGPILPPQLSGLKNLDLSKCNLSYLPDDAFTTTPNISRLLLNDNKLKNDKDSFLKFLESLAELEQLDLSFNNITTVTPDKFSNNYQLMSLKLIGNPWKCDCYVVRMWEWASEKGNIGILVSSTKSMASNMNNKKTKSLVCNFDPKSTPVKLVKPRPGRELTVPVPRTWARYVREANCPRGNSRQTRVVREIHEYQSMPLISEIENETQTKWLPLMSFCAILLIVSLVMMSILIKRNDKTIKKDKVILNDISQEVNDAVQFKGMKNVSRRTIK